MGNPATVTSGRLVGRLAERRRLADVLSASAQGLPAAVLVHGEAGVGKTQLVRELTEHYAALGHQVFVGHLRPFRRGLGALRAGDSGA